MACYGKVSQREKVIRLAMIEAGMAGRKPTSISRTIKAGRDELAAIEAEGRRLGVLGVPGTTPVGVESAAWVCGVSERRMRNFLDEGRLGGRLAGKRTYAMHLADVVAFAKLPRKVGFPAGRQKVPAGAPIEEGVAP
jgi:hypothetical protein